MGFDLNGLAPKGATIPRPTRPEPEIVGKDKWKYDKKELEEYHNKFDKWQEQSGTYFRNNVWWWRPLAEYVLKYTKVIPNTKKHREGWNTNSGYQVSNRYAEEIAKQLKFLIDTGHTKKFQTDYMKEFVKAEKFNEGVQKEMDKLNNLPRNKDLAPCNYNKKDKKEWDRLYAKQKLIASYPFSVKNVEEFMDFCNKSGGFEIC